MPLPSLILADHWAPLTRAWSEAFAPFEAVHVHDGDFFALDADAMVSPANSFGIMDGGLDAAIRAELGGHVQTDVQARILERHHGELPVGAAEIVPTHHARWPFLVVAPTMRVPESVAHTLNAYLSFRAWRCCDTTLRIRRRRSVPWWCPASERASERWTRGAAPRRCASPSITFPSRRGSPASG